MYLLQFLIDCEYNKLKWSRKNTSSEFKKTQNVAKILRLDIYNQ